MEWIYIYIYIYIHMYIHSIYIQRAKHRPSKIDFKQIMLLIFDSKKAIKK